MAIAEQEIHSLKQRVDRHDVRLDRHDEDIDELKTFCAGEKEITASIRASLAKLEKFADTQQSKAGRIAEKIGTAVLTALTVAFVMWLFQKGG